MLHSHLPPWAVAYGHESRPMGAGRRSSSPDPPSPEFVARSPVDRPETDVSGTMPGKSPSLGVLPKTVCTNLQAPDGRFTAGAN